jgi:hypothetical protein
LEPKEYCKLAFYQIIEAITNLICNAQIQLLFQRQFAMTQLNSADEQTHLKVEEYCSDGYKKKLDTQFMELPDDDEKLINARQKQE